MNAENWVPLDIHVPSNLLTIKDVIHLDNLLIVNLEKWDEANKPVLFLKVTFDIVQAVRILDRETRATFAHMKEDDVGLYRVEGSRFIADLRSNGVDWMRESRYTNYLIITDVDSVDVVTDRAPLIQSIR